MSLSEVADLYIILRAITQPFTDSMAKAGVEGEAAGERINGGIGKVSPVLLGITAATGLAAAMSVKWASDFETQYTRLYTAAGASKQAVLDNRDAMLKLGTATGFTGTQIAEALYHPVSAGLDLATALQVVKYSAEEARISGANLDDTTYGLSSVMKAFNQSANDAGPTMAQLNAIVGDGDMRFQDFNASIKNWAPTAAGMGISIQSMGAALAYLTDRGMAADVASTRVTMGLVMMATPSAQAAKLLEGMGVASGDVKASSEAMTDALQKAHVTQNQLALDLQKPDGINVALTHLKTALEKAGVSGTEADSTLSKIFGGGRSDKAVLALMANLDGLKQKYDQIGKDSSAQKFQQDWEDAQKTTAVQFDKLKAQVINLGTQLGMVLLPPLKQVLGYITSGIKWITEHKEAMIALAAVISGAVVGALYAMGAALVSTAVEAMANPIVDIVAALAIGAIELVTHWKQVKTFFEDLFAWISGHKTMLLMILGPIFPWLTAFIALASEVITHWKGIWGFLQQLAGDFKQWGKDVANFFVHAWDDLEKWAKEGWQKAEKVSKDVWDDMKKAWNDTVSFLERIWNDTGGKLIHEISTDWDSATSAISGEWHHISDDLSSIWGSLQQIWDGTGGRVVHYIADVMDWASGVIHRNWSEIKQFFTGVWQGIWGTVKPYLDMIKTGIQVTWDTIKGITKIVWDLVSNIIRTAWDFVWGMVKVYIDLIWGYIKAGWDLIKGGTQIAWDLIKGFINTPLDFIKDTLKLFADFFTGRWSKLWSDVERIANDLWNNIWNTIKNTISDIIKTVIKAGGDLISGFSKAINDGLGTIFTAVENIWKTITGFFKDTIHWLYQAGKDLIQGLINGIGDMANGAMNAVSNIADSVWSSAKHGFGLWSPSHIAYEHGQMIVQGLINGLNSMAGQAGSTMLDLTKGVNANLPGGAGVGGPSGGLTPFTTQGAYAPGVINITVQGAVLSDRDLRDVVQEQMLQLGARYSTSYTPYKR
jgi:TP901 family phage tail tape measure protein